MRLSEQLQEAVSKKTFVVFRLGSGSPSLDDKNAGNMEAVIGHLDDYSEKGIGHGDRITAYRVTAEAPFGDYVELVRGRPRQGPGQTDRVGYAKGGSAAWPREVYSFPKGGRWTAKKLKTVALTDLDKLSRKHGATEYEGRKLSGFERTFFARGWVEQKDLLKKAFGVR
jgi:hypothetical protein